METRPDWSVLNIDKLTYAAMPENLAHLEKAPRYSFIKGDISDTGLLTKLFAEKEFDYIVNFAAESHVDRSIEGPAEFLRTNVTGTFTLLEAAREKWKNNADKLFLHVSTDEVYGTLGPEGRFTEETPYSPRSPYSASKASSDHFAMAYYHTYGLPVIVTNCSNNYGPFQYPEKFIPVVLRSIIAEKPIPVYGDGKNVRDWLFVKDHCEALLTVLEKGTAGASYNIGGGNEKTNVELARELCAVLDRKLGRKNSERLIDFVTDRPGHDKRYAVDYTKICSELGWAPRTLFTDGLQQTAEWYIKFFKTGNIDNID